MLHLFNLSVPRYTSYPTAPQFVEMGEAELRERLHGGPYSLYVHIPFCKSMCLFCGCSVILNRNPERQEKYVESLLKEIALLGGRRAAELHLGGGTPTSLTEEQFERLMSTIRRHFAFERGAEISIEIDPRTVFPDQGKKLKALKELGFTRVSFGVQDLDPAVQEAVRRRQSEEMTRFAYEKARELAFNGINIDLIYGLPLQTVKNFQQTIQSIIQMRPDRIALYSYANVPWIKEHQKAIPQETLPSPEEKLAIYISAREHLLNAGYIAIGMDHFSLPEDGLAKAYKTNTLTRNFQGYAVKPTSEMLGLGVTAIGYSNGAYFQNTKDLETYHALLAENKLPVAKGLILTPDDLTRKEAIMEIMCKFQIDKRIDLFDLVQEGLLTETPTHYVATDMGRLFIRVIASRFDAYLSKGTYSKVV